MKSPRGKRVAILTTLLGLAVLAAAALASRDRLREEWYLHALKVGDKVERVAAAKWLADMGSIRAVPIFIDMIRNDEREEVSFTRLRIIEADGVVYEVRARILLDNMEDLFSHMGAEKQYTITLHLTPILLNLLKASSEAIPCIERALAEKAEARRVPNALKILKTILEKEGSNLEIGSEQDLEIRIGKGSAMTVALPSPGELPAQCTATGEMIVFESPGSSD